ncbi:hypothetical protein F4860DRAFT_482360 [Xylaria cubensis]|nr:hypothetical protein F4860DRAFT_482360 [Xylaria cubensis]
MLLLMSVPMLAVTLTDNCANSNTQLQATCEDVRSGSPARPRAIASTPHSHFFTYCFTTSMMQHDEPVMQNICDPTFLQLLYNHTLCTLAGR